MIKILLVILLISTNNLFSQFYDSPKSRFNKTVNKTIIDSSIDVKYYGIFLKIKPEDRAIFGEVEINYKQMFPISTASFNLSSLLVVDSLKSSNNKIPFSHKNNLITLNQADIFTDSISKIKVYYHGSPQSSGFGSFNFSSHNGIPWVYTLSEPYGSKDWFPCKDDPSDKADSVDIFINVPSSIIAVSNGLLTGTVQLLDNTTYKWHESYPIAPYLIAITCGDFEHFTSTFTFNGKTMPVDNYIFFEDELDLSSINETPAMLNVFSNYYGEYPFIKEKYGHVRFGWSGGMEHQTLSSMGTFGPEIISHELAHQWFGDKVTCSDWHNIWLNEGFAEFSTALYYQATKGDRVYKSYINTLMASALLSQGSIYIKDVSSEANIFDYNLTYAKGAVVVYMLRHLIGDNFFFTALNNYLNDPKFKYGNASIEDFRRVVEAASGLNLKYFFDEWIYGEGYPKYDFNWNFTKVDDKFEIKISLDQIFNSTPEYFTMPVQFEISTIKKDTVITFYNNAKQQSFTFTMMDEPIEIVLDPDNKILKKVFNNSNRPPDSWELFQNYPNPFNGTTNITFMNTSASDVKIELYDVLGSKLLTIVDDYFSAGTHTIKLNSDRLASGIYFYKLNGGNKILTRKLVLVK